MKVALETLTTLRLGVASISARLLVEPVTVVVCRPVLAPRTHTDPAEFVCTVRGSSADQYSRLHFLQVIWLSRQQQSMTFAPLTCNRRSSQWSKHTLCTLSCLHSANWPSRSHLRISSPTASRLCIEPVGDRPRSHTLASSATVKGVDACSPKARYTAAFTDDRWHDLVQKSRWSLVALDSVHT